MELKIIEKEKFNELASEFECCNFFQTSNMGEYLESKGKEVYFLGLFDDQKVVGVTILSESYKFLNKKSYECLKGFLIDYKNIETVKIFCQKLVEFVKSKGGYKLSIDPYIKRITRDIDGNEVTDKDNNLDVIKCLENIGFRKSKKDVQVRYNFCLDLDKNEDDIFKDFKATTRNIINKAIREGVEIFNLTYDELPEFKKITEYTCNKRGLTDKPLEYYQSMFNLFVEKVVFKMAKLNINKYKKYLNDTKQDLENKLANIKNNNKKKDNYLFEIDNIDKKIAKINAIAKDDEYLPLACAMFMLYGDETIYLFSGGYDEYSEFGGQYLIQWDIIKYAINNKYKRHNFFGIYNYTDTKSPEYGIYLFKRGFNGYVEELVGEYYYPLGLVGNVYKIKEKIK